MPVTWRKKKPSTAGHTACLAEISPSVSGKTAGVASSKVTGQITSPAASHPIDDEHAGEIHTRLDRQRAAEFLTSHGYKITADRLAKLAASKGGPEYRRWGKRVYYYPDALLKWAEAREEIVVPHGGGGPAQ
jgi:hypothetical protein